MIGVDCGVVAGGSIVLADLTEYDTGLVPISVKGLKLDETLLWRCYPALSTLTLLTRTLYLSDDQHLLLTMFLVGCIL